MLVRAEAFADHEAIRAVVGAAFGGTTEILLIDLIRAAPGFDPDLSLIAEWDGEVVGHVLFSPAAIEGEERFEVRSLAPLAVHPDFQRRGVGTALVEEGLARCDARDVPLVVVEGIPAYYPRLGFAPARDLGIAKPEERIPDEAFMAKPLTAYDPRIRGRFVYPPPFYEADAVGP